MIGKIIFLNIFLLNLNLTNKLMSAILPKYTIFECVFVMRFFRVYFIKNKESVLWSLLEEQP